jgi:putative ABC transport system substrate-binding protein
MRRREFVRFLAGAVATWPLSVRAQQTAIPVIGYFSSRSVDAEAALRTPILKELADAGFVVGQNVLIEYRFAEGHHDKLQGLSADLVGEGSNFDDPDRFHHR